jgi:hypothetical protein
MEQNQKKIVKFESVKEEILDALKRRSIKITEPVTLLDGFINEPFGKELSDSFVIGGPTIPMIVLIGDDSGQIYFFALKAILPNIGL